MPSIIKFESHSYNFIIDLYFLFSGLIVEEPEGIRPRNTYSPFALGVIIGIGVALILFIVVFILSVGFGAYRLRKQRQINFASKK